MPQRTYLIAIEWKNDGETYAAERYMVTAPSKKAARTKAQDAISGSRYNDERIPDRRAVITTSDLVATGTAAIH